MAVHGYIVCDLCGKSIVPTRFGCDFGGSISVESGSVGRVEESEYPEDYKLQNVCAGCLKETIRYLERIKVKGKRYGH